MFASFSAWFIESNAVSSLRYFFAAIRTSASIAIA